MQIGQDHTIAVVGVLETLTWAGGAGDLLHFSFYVSKDNAAQLKSLMAANLKSRSIEEFGWYIARYDDHYKTWFGENYPDSPPKPAGQLYVTGPDISLNVGDKGVQIAEHSDVQVFPVSLDIAPPVDQLVKLLVSAAYQLHVVRNWGIELAKS